MKLPKLHWSVVLALLGTLVATYFAPAPGEDTVLLTDRPGRVAAKSATPTGSSRPEQAPAGDAQVLAIRPRDQDDEENDSEVDLFTPARWGERASPQSSVPVSPESSVPEEAKQTQRPPFHYLGRYVSGDGRVAFFLQYNEQNLVVYVGDTLPDQYKVESFSGSMLNLRYLPQNTQQTIDVGSGN